MRLYVRHMRKAAIMLFRRGSEADYEKSDSIHAHNSAVAAEIFSGIISGEFADAYSVHGPHMDVYSRSIRHADCVQISRFCMMGGNWEATSHSDAYSPRDIRFSSGGYINIHRGE